MTEEKKMEIAAACRQARLDNGMTVRDMSDFTGKTYSYSEISLIETGKRKLPLELAMYYQKIGADISAILS